MKTSSETATQPNHRSYHLLYCICMVAYGANVIGLGSYIPYLATQTNTIETQFSYFFSCRSFGMLAGAMLIRLLQKMQFSNHKLLISGAIFITVCAQFFAMSRSQFALGLWLFLGSVGFAMFEVIVNVCILLISPDNEVDYWMLMAHGAFGIGGLISPLVVYLFQINSFFVFGLLVFALLPFFYRLESPQISGFVPQHKTCPVKQSKLISKRLQYMLCLFIFMYVGLECTYGGWISSFAVMRGVTDQQGATLFPALFWVMITIFRFMLAFLPGKSQWKLKILIQGNILTGVISLILIQMGYLQLACYVSAILFGLSMSSIFPLVFVFPIEAGLIINDAQATNIGTSVVVSEGILTMIVGLLMEWFNVDWLFYSLLIITIVLWLIRYYSLILIDRQLQSLKELGQEMIEKVSPS